MIPSVGLLKLFSTALDPTARAVRMSSFQQDQVRQVEKAGEVSNDVSFGTCIAPEIHVQRT